MCCRSSPSIFFGLRDRADDPQAKQPGGDQPAEQRAAVQPFADKGQVDQITVSPLLRLSPPDESWTSLFQHKPAVFLHDQSGASHFTFDDNRYVVTSPKSRWLSKCAQVGEGSLEIETVMRVHQWIGMGGVFWGLRRDRSALPETGYRCYLAEFSRLDDQASARLYLLELSIAEEGFESRRIKNKRTIAFKDVSVPPNSSSGVAFRLMIEPKTLSIRFHNEPAWVPELTISDRQWTVNGESEIGLCGQGEYVEFHGAEYRSVRGAASERPPK